MRKMSGRWPQPEIWRGEKMLAGLKGQASKYKRRCEEMVEKHRTQMEEAAELLRRQVNETIEAQQQLTDAHQKKEASLRVGTSGLGQGDLLDPVEPTISRSDWGSPTFS
eukprot:s2057_g2.t1